jgi:hypothetical protein
MNWNRGASIAVLKRQISGSEASRPRQAKILPIQRWRSGRSRGMNNIRIAPTSGVKRIVFRILLSESIQCPHFEALSF